MQKAYKTPKDTVVSIAHGEKSGFMLVVTVPSRRKNNPGYINNLKISQRRFHFDTYEEAELKLDELAAKNQWTLL